MNATTVVAVDGKPKLLDRVRNALRVRHLARSTEKAYVYWCRRYILYHNKRHPLDMGKQEIEAVSLDTRYTAVTLQDPIHLGPRGSDVVSVAEYIEA
jgi:hypothetical protein